MSERTSALNLSPHQRDLLVAALSSNQPVRNKPSMAPRASSQGAVQPYTPTDSSALGSGRLDYNDESPFLDLPLDGEDGFDFDEQGQMFGDLPGDDDYDNDTTDPDHLHNKRKSMGDLDEDDEGGGKRREGDHKQAKKPGRKPLMNEPTTVSTSVKGAGLEC